MPQFLHIPPLEIGDNGQWILAEDCTYESDLIPYLITVPEGFETDLASIPRPFLPLIPKNGRHRAAAIIHDYLCRTEAVRRKVADRIFREAMKVLGVPGWKRWAMYYAVRIGSVL